MNSKQLWNSHQRHKLLWAKASRDILKIRVLEMGFQEVFSTSDTMLFHQNTRKPGNNAIPDVPRHCPVQTFHRPGSKSV